jgi:hypothetical protein
LFLPPTSTFIKKQSKSEQNHDLGLGFVFIFPKNSPIIAATLFCVVLLHKRIFTLAAMPATSAHVQKMASAKGKNAMTSHAYEARTGIAPPYVAKETGSNLG